MSFKRMVARAIDATVKRRYPGAHLAYTTALRIVSAYENNDVEMDSNGELWLQERIFSRKHAIAFDVGANVGDWLAPAAAYKGDFRIFAYEAAPKTFQKLLNRVNDTRILLVNKAVSSKCGLLTLRQSNSNHYISSIYDTSDWVPDTDIDVVSIHATTGDVEIDLHAVEHIDIVKIDVEGHDLSVVRGFSTAIKRGIVDFIQFEYNSYTLLAGVSLRDFFKELVPLYVLCRLLPNGLEATGYFPALDNFRQSNWVAVRAGHLTRDVVRYFNIRCAKGLGRRALLEQVRDDPRIIDALDLIT